MIDLGTAGLTTPEKKNEDTNNWCAVLAKNCSTSQKTMPKSKTAKKETINSRKL